MKHYVGRASSEARQIQIKGALCMGDTGMLVWLETSGIGKLLKKTAGV